MYSTKQKRTVYCSNKLRKKSVRKNYKVLHLLTKTNWLPLPLRDAEKRSKKSVTPIFTRGPRPHPSSHVRVCLRVKSSNFFRANLYVQNVKTDISEILAQFHHQCSTHSFYAWRSWKHKKILMTWLYFFTLSGSMSVKASCKTLVKLTPAVSWITVWGK